MKIKLNIRSIETISRLLSKTNILSGHVEPVAGTVLFCPMIGFEHTGIYIGENHIVQLSSDGSVKRVTPSEFLPATGTDEIYVACNGRTPISSQPLADLATSMIGKKLGYTIQLDNCHKFVCDCITGDFSMENYVTYNTKRALSFGSALTVSSFKMVEEIIALYMSNDVKPNWIRWHHGNTSA